MVAMDAMLFWALLFIFKRMTKRFILAPTSDFWGAFPLTKIPTLYQHKGLERATYANTFTPG